MFESIMNFFKKLGKTENKETKSKEKAKERLHLVLMQDRANVSADFLEMMKQEIIEVIKKYIEVDEKEIDVRLTNEVKEDGTTGAPSLYANIPIMNIRNEMKKEVNNEQKEEKKEEKSEEIKKEDTKESKDIKEDKKEDTKKEEHKEIKETEKEEDIKKEKQEGKTEPEQVETTENLTESKKETEKKNNEKSGE